jgi:hypothetical protein
MITVAPGFGGRKPGLSVCGRGVIVQRIFLTALSVLLTISGVQARGPYGSIGVGNWKGGAYANDQTGEFSHCAAGAPYLSGIYFMVMVDRNMAWGLGFAKDDWKLTPGQVFQMALTFDGQTPFNVQGSATTQNLVNVPMPTNSSLIAQFRKAKAMTVFTQGQLFQFKLDQTAQLLPTLANCVTVVSKNGVAGAGDFSVRVPAPNPPQKTVPVVSSLTPNPQPPTSPELQIEAIELASNFVLKTNLQNPRVLNRSETPGELASYGAAWKSDEATGSVRIIPAQGETKGIDVAAAVVAADAKECKGKFISGRNSELVDSDVVFRGVATCEDSSGTRVSQYFIVPRKKGGFVMFSVLSGMKTEQAKTITKEERLADFRKAALVVVGP